MPYSCPSGVRIVRERYPDDQRTFGFQAVTFLKHWKQKNAEITHRWDLMEFEEEEVSISL